MPTRAVKAEPPVERIAPIEGHHIVTPRYTAHRGAGSMTGLIKTNSRTSAELRQKIATQMATITETATVTEIRRGRYDVAFTATHQILPIT